MENSLIRIRNFDLINNIKNISKDLDCEFKVNPPITNEDCAMITISHDNTNICRYARYLAERMILEVQHLNEQIKDIKVESLDLDLSGLNITDNTKQVSMV